MEHKRNCFGLTIVYIVCMFIFFMVTLRKEASTIPEVEEWWYHSFNMDDTEVYDIHVSLRGSTNDMRFTVISGDGKDTIDTYITYEMFKKMFKNLKEGQ